MQIEIVSRPQGEAPESVRDAWIGVVLPIAPGYPGLHTCPKFGVLSYPKTKFGQLWAILIGRVDRVTGYLVDAHAAVEQLTASAPEAADWWRKNASALISHGKLFMFDSAACKVVSGLPPNNSLERSRDG